MNTFKLSKKLLITSAFLMSSFLFALGANAQDVSYASAGQGGATAYSASTDNGYGNGYGLYSYPVYNYGSYGIYSNNNCGTGYAYNDCNPCSQGYGGYGIYSNCNPCSSSILQSIPVINALAAPCNTIGQALGNGITYVNSYGLGNHFRFLRL